MPTIEPNGKGNAPWSENRTYSFPRNAQLVKKNTAGRFIYPATIVVLGVGNSFYKLFIYKHRCIREEYDIAIAFSGHFNDLTFVANDFIRAKTKMCWLHGVLYGYLITSDGFGILSKQKCKRFKSLS